MYLSAFFVVPVVSIPQKTGKHTVAFLQFFAIIAIKKSIEKIEVHHDRTEQNS